MPLIPPTPSYAKRPDMADAMMQRINASRAKKDERINVVPKPLVGRMKSKLFEGAKEEPLQRPSGEGLGSWMLRNLSPREEARVAEEEVDMNEDSRKILRLESWIRVWMRTIMRVVTSRTGMPGL
jgi:hypothetical protein